MLYTQQAPTNDWSDTDKLIRNVAINLNHLKAIDKAQEEKGESLLYRYITRQVADGQAYYQIIRVTKTQVTLRWCEGVCPDGYIDDLLGKLITLQRYPIENLVKHRVAMGKFHSH